MLTSVLSHVQAINLFYSSLHITKEGVAGVGLRAVQKALDKANAELVEAAESKRTMLAQVEHMLAKTEGLKTKVEFINSSMEQMKATLEIAQKTAELEHEGRQEPATSIREL